MFAGFAVKLVLNAISTGANILKGRVFGNSMVNLTVANDKVHVSSCNSHDQATKMAKIERNLYLEASYCCLVMYWLAYIITLIIVIMGICSE